MLSPAAHWRSAAADTFALVVYCFIAGMAIEVLISGMSFQQSSLRACCRFRSTS